MSGPAAQHDTQTSRRPGRLQVTTVSAVHRLTPRMTRLTFTGPGLGEFLSNGTDQHVALYFYPPGLTLPRPFTTEAARALLPTARPRLRRYTIRHHRPELGEVDMDFVLHGADQLASGWAERAAVGEESIWFGPSPAYPLREGPAWSLLLGDETALPALGVLLEELPAGHPVTVLAEIADPDEQLPLPTRADADIRWLHRGDRPAGELLAAHATALRLPPGRGRIWGGAEREVVRTLRHHFTRTLGVDRADTRLTTYWTRGETQDSEV
ncbi:siderophore-interacting protein [Streptomyces physcomitrii]|uniref:Siderophore-interacting protein n=1 Tax=Streptomyces physcomitrii TaxID=2724184 RepID=A0ABX1H631_9ACTN|nr:siderophore-interacting protein [Streptomyces physcomitrii]NKI43817.1 siderophore-interacting protein [Streptomyces physcomitrii]